MSGSEQHSESFDTVKARLEEIANAVSSDDMPLDEALDLFEEAVALGMQVSDLLEEGVFVDVDELSEDGALNEAVTNAATVAETAADVVAVDDAAAHAV